MFNFDNILFLPAFTSPIFLIVGFIMFHFPPKKINYLYGYRTNSSMQSQERWDFAQKYSAIQMMKMACAMFVISIMFSIFSFKENTNLIIGVIILLINIGYIGYKVEKAIKFNFPKK